MLTIRAEQMNNLERAQEARFRDDLVEQLKSFAPRLCEIVGEAAVQQAVRRGLAKADSYGFTYRGPARFYTELTFVLGANFDTDPQLPWAARILNDKHIANQMSRADFLYKGMNEYLDRVAGRENVNAIAALQSLQLIWPSIEPTLSVAGDREIVNLFSSIYPEKAQYMGEDIALSVIRSAERTAQDLAVPSSIGTMLFSGLMLSFGHGVLNDPLYPWISSSISESSRGTGEERAKKLIKKTKLYLDRVLAYYLG